MRQPETTIQNAIQDYIKDNGGDVFKVHGSSMQRAGEPDLCGEIPILGEWVHFKIEVKTPTGVPSALQKVRLRRYHMRGYLVGVVTSVADTSRLIEAYTLFKANNGLVTWEAVLKLCEIEDTYHIYTQEAQHD